MPQLLSLRHYHHEQIAHSHQHAQLVIGLSGRLDFEVEGRGCLVGYHGLAVVPADTHHICASAEGSRCLVLDVPDDDWLQQRLGQHANAGRRLLQTAQHLQLNASQSQLVDWLAACPINDPVIAQQGAALLLSTLSSSDLMAARPIGLPLAALNAYIDKHCGHPLQVADLARVCGLSAARFHARFLAETGHTPMEHVRARRLQLGRELLLGSQLPVGEIAARVGYASQSAFTAALGRSFGITPRQLRRESLAKNNE